MNHKLLTKYYLNYFESKKSGSDVDRISMTLLNSKIKLTPHQIDASLFAFKSPISKGVILADEVGLGKTIEAGIIIAQLWYERKAKILIIVPAALIRQWNSELYDKFMLDSTIIDRKLFNSYIKKGYDNPFNECGNIVICSYQFASINKDYIFNSNFDTVIIDEAHKLRNVYDERSITSNNIKYATQNMHKILLTATPIQNSLMDLYGLTSFIDDNIFGDKNIFKLNYIKNLSENEKDLKTRLSSFMHRTLRSQVTQYIRYTNRIAKTFTFEQTPEEVEIYSMLKELINNASNYPYIIPKGQSHLLLLIMTKLMGSSVAALQGTLEVILKRLNSIKEGNIDIEITDYFKTDELIDEIEDEDIVQLDNQETEEEQIDLDELNREIDYINSILSKTKVIKKESKYFALLESLKYSENQLKNLGANNKVLIFTESTRTQKFLYESLMNDGFEDISLFNGSNNDEESNKIYNEWISRPENADKKNNTKSLNMRSAIIDKFSKDGKILIATEAGAEGLNLQFCSMIINYDLPWNPQRVEQRIGRCHRFGQKYDVTVINFINKSNRAEQRIYELLSTKFNLFNEVFGASDEILGTLESDTNIELAISNIYKECRTEEEIDKAFDQLQIQYSNEIDQNINKTKQKIIDNFEEDLQQYFSDMMNSTEKTMNEVERNFWILTKLVLENNAIFNDDDLSFEVKTLDSYQGKYKLSSRNEDNEFIDYNSNTNLGKYILEQANNITEDSGKIIFDVTDYPYKLTEAENLKGCKGIISFNKFKISSYENEEYLFATGLTNNGVFLDNALINKLFRVSTNEMYNVNIDSVISQKVGENSKIYSNKLLNESTEKNNNYLNQEIIKINKWADDKIQSTQYNVELMREQRKELQKQSDLSTNSNDKVRIEEQISALTKKISKSWMELAQSEEEIENKRADMVSKIKKENMKSSSLENIFTVEFEVV